MNGHGTITRYIKHRCRCVACRDAMRDYRRRERAGQIGPRRAEHGTYSKYVRGCRCSDCTQANTDYSRQYQRRLRGVPVEAPTRRREAVDPNWAERAACRGKDPSLWFPERGSIANAKQLARHPAIVICRSCPVQVECLDHALANNEKGIWGGLSGQARRDLRSRKQSA